MDSKHSGLGVSSFALSILAGIGLFAVFGWAGISHASSPTGIDEESVLAVAIGLATMLAIALNLVAAGLGIAGIVQKSKKRLFAVLGLCFSLAFTVSALAIVGIGLAGG